MIAEEEEILTTLMIVVEMEIQLAVEEMQALMIVEEILMTLKDQEGILMTMGEKQKVMLVIVRIMEILILDVKREMLNLEERKIQTKN